MELNDINLQELVYEELNDQFQKAVDLEMSNFLMMLYYEEQGWFKIELDRIQDNNHAVDITHWLVNHGFFEKINYYRDGRKFLFKNKEDATMFILKWS